MLDNCLVFGAFRLLGSTGPLLRNGEEIRLSPRARTILWQLASRAGHSVSKEYLLNAAWPKRVVGEGSLAVCIREIRVALGDDRKKPQFIQTDHGQGYRFIADVEDSAAHESAAAFVGRQSSLAELDALFELANRAQRQTVFISGEAGIGKTALIEGWLARIAAATQAQTARGQCFDQGSTAEPYLPFLYAIKSMCYGPNAETMLSILSRVAPTWAAQFPQFLPHLATSVSHAEADATDAELMRSEFENFIVALSAERPVILILEDIHWCDASSVMLLDLLARRSEPARLLILASFRSTVAEAGDRRLAQIRQDLSIKKKSREIALGDLSRTEVETYLADRFAAAPRREFLDAVFGRTAGHPFFLVALCDHLEQARVISPEAIQRLVPEDLVAFLNARFTEIDETARVVLEAACVTGAEFALAELTAATGLDEAECEDIVEQMARPGGILRDCGVVVWPDRTVTATYRFRHALYSDTIAATLSDLRRTRLHHAIAHRLQQGWSGREHELAARLARHFEGARDHAAAISYLTMAAAESVKKFAYIEASNFLNHGLDLLCEVNEPDIQSGLELQLQLAHGPILVAMEGYGSSAVRHAFARAGKLVDKAALSEYRFPVLRGLAAYHSLRAEYDVSLEIAQRLSEHNAEPGLPATSAALESAFLKGVILYFRGAFLKSRAALSEVARLYDPALHGDHAVQFGIDPGSMSLCFSALTNWQLGEAAKVESDARAGLRYAEAADHPFTLAQCHATLAHLAQLQGDVEETKRQSDLAADLAAEHSFKYLLASETARAGWIALRRGSIGSGLAQISEGIARYRETGARAGLTGLLLTQAEACLLGHEIEDGIAIIDQTVTLAETTTEYCYVAELLRLKGELLRHVSDGPQRPTEAFEASIRLAQKQSARRWEQGTRLSLQSHMS